MRIRQLGYVSGKLVACVLIIVCVAVGAVGVIMPLIPGLLFLVVAAILLARHFPLTERWLRKNHAMSDCLDRADALTRLDWPARAKLGALVCLKILLDGAAAVGGAVARGVAGLGRRYPEGR